MEARVYRAQLNPAGIEYWSEVWIQLPRLGGLLIPIWIPKDIGSWKRRESVVADGYFFKNYRYENREESYTQAPLFVAGNLKHLVVQTHPVTRYVGIGFAVLVALMILLFFRMARKSSQETKEHEALLTQRRQRRRQQQQSLHLDSPPANG